MDDNKDIRFIASRYCKGLFDTERALRRVKRKAPSWWTRTRIAAAIAAAVVLTASAAFIIRHDFHSDRDIPAPETTAVPAAPTDFVTAIDFEDAPLPLVVEKISEVYGVEIINVPENAENYHLSLHYEGTAEDLVMTINEILDTDMQTAR